MSRQAKLTRADFQQRGLKERYCQQHGHNRPLKGHHQGWCQECLDAHLATQSRENLTDVVRFALRYLTRSKIAIAREKLHLPPLAPKERP